MKFKGLTKIALAGAAVAVTAATLATSTYAWYVTNSTATVDGITGSTASVAGGNILVAQALDGANGNIPGNFSTKFSLRAGNILQPLKVTATPGDNPTYTKQEGFAPVTPGTFVAGANAATPGTLTADATLTNWVDENGSAITVGTPAWASESSGTAGDRRYMEFKIWLMSTDDVATTTMTLKVTNTKADPNKQTAYTTVGMENHEVGDEFVINAAEALRFAYIEDDYEFAAATPTSNPKDEGLYEKGTSNGVANGNYVLTEDTTPAAGKTYYEMTAATGNAANYNIFGVKEVTTVGTTYLEPADTYDSSNNMDANEYYYGVMGQYAVGSTVASNNAIYSVAAPTLKLPTMNGTTGYATLALEANVAKKLTFRIWLEGTDAQCFDCCSGQSFSFEIGFEK